MLLNDPGRGATVQSRRFVVRAYLAAASGGAVSDGYEVMPGGLTRVTGSTDTLVVSLQKGGGSKDTWVLADGPVSDLTLLAAATQPVELSRGGSDLPSRVADDLYWLGRYVQRADAKVRLARAVFNRLLDPTTIESPQTIRVLVQALLDRPAVRAGGGSGGDGTRADRELVADVFGPADRGGLRATVRSVYSLARLLRDRISADAWRILQSAERDVADFNVNVDDDQVPTVLELLNRLTAGFLALAGVAADSMTRGQSWRFLDMGFRVERATAVTRLVRLTLVDATREDPSLLEAVLEAGDSALTYRRRYLTQLEAPAVVDLLLADETNPRAVAFQVAALQDHLAALPHDATHPNRNPDLQAAMQLRTMLRLADLPAACAAHEGLRPRLDRLLADTADGLTAVSDAVSQMYFSHAAAGRRLLGPAKERVG